MADQSIDLTDPAVVRLMRALELLDEALELVEPPTPIPSGTGRIPGTRGSSIRVARADVLHQLGDALVAIARDGRTTAHPEPRDPARRGG